MRISKAAPLSLVACLAACATARPQPERPPVVQAEQPPAPANPAKVLVGTWKEYWGVGEPTNVTYNDLYVIAQGPDQRLRLSCRGRDHYDFPRVDFDGKRLKVRMYNPENARDVHIIDYDLALEGDRWLKGRAQTNHGINTAIEWEKVE